MPNKRPERDEIERLLKDRPGRKAHDIAAAVGLIDTMGYDAAVTYINNIRKALRKKGELGVPRFASDEDRLEDITKLFEIRQGKMSQKAAFTMLTLNCYLRLRSQDDCIHMDAIDDTYRKNAKLEKPLDLKTAVSICQYALKQYMESRDEEKNIAARTRGFPGAGINYTTQRLIERLEITDEEIGQLKSIKKEEP